MEEKRFKISYNKKVAELLTELKASIVISTYQAGKLIFIGSKNNTSLYQVPISFKKPMGIALLDNKMAVATLDEIQIFSASKALAKLYPNNPGKYDKLFLPRATYYCGETDLHDLGFANGGLWAVNTRFSCISTYDINYSFTPRWAPPFITELFPEDRCHLNGMAMINKKPAFVTALSKTNIKDGWRANITKTGILMNVPEGEIILENLPMPHSPRIINNSLYLLLSATGEIIKVNEKNKSYQTITKINGFIRGLAEYKNYLFVGLSKIRKTSKTFNQLPITDHADYSGIVIIRLSDGHIMGEIKYESTVEEIYDVQILPDLVLPGLISPNDEKHKLAVTTKHISFWKNEKKQSKK